MSYREEYRTPFRQHNAALHREEATASRALPGQGLTEAQYLAQLNDTLQAENARLMAETLRPMTKD